MDATFNNTAAGVSAHFGVGLDGRIHAYVHPEDTAWANGILEPGYRWPGPDRVNPNLLSVSIETVDNGDPQNTPVSPTQYAATRAICRAMVGRYPGIVYLVSHRAISPLSRSCPGARWLDTGHFDQLAADTHLSPVR